MPAKPEPIDIKKIRETIAAGRRARWWVRKGGKGKGFHYEDATGKRVTDDEDIARINSLVIPPAWRHVRINPKAGGRVQCVGIDAIGRIQYRYHPDFSAKQQRRKFSRIERFGEYLPKLRAVTNAHIMLDGFPKEKVLAIVVRLINSLYFRVGTDLSVKRYRTFGITTLQNKHLTIGRGGKLEFAFVGKSGVHHRKVLVDKELADLMKQLKELGRAGRLFHFVNGDGKPRPIKPNDINAYIKEATGAEFTSKDFRTWGATLLAAADLAELGPAEKATELKSNLVRVVKRVASELGNTPAVCRSSYIHPGVFDLYSKGVTLEEFRPRRARSIRRIQEAADPEEIALLRLLMKQ